jgi:hypothetical protein
MLTLDRWRSFLATPRTIAFPRLELIGRDHAPPVVVGTGEVRMDSPSDFEFTLTGMPDDPDDALSEFNRIHENPYDGLARPRLRGVDADGIEWNGGYAVPHVTTRLNGWTFGGRIDGLLTEDQSETVSTEAGVELIFLLRIGDPMALAMARYARTGASGTDYATEILGSKIRFAYERATLLVTASGSPELPSHFAENWLAEPLRIIFGQLIFPRLVARNFGDGRAQVSVRPSPGIVSGARWAALWEGDYRCDNETFWSRYTQLLRLIARASGEGGQSSFDAHKITRLYQEIIQAARGSRWVWALTFASSIEALVNMLTPKGAKPTEVEAEAIAALVKHIGSGPGAKDDRLKKIAINAVHRTAALTTIRVLRELVCAGVISEEQLSAWEKVRNAAMHGSLVSPYSNRDEDARLLALAGMMHALTHELIRSAEDARR